MRMFGKKTNLLGFSTPNSKEKEVDSQMSKIKKKIEKEDDWQIDLNLQIASIQSLTPNKRHSKKQKLQKEKE